MTSIGDLKIGLLLDDKIFNDKIRNAFISIARLSAAGNKIGLFEKIDVTKFISSISKAESETNKLESSINRVKQAVDNVNNSANSSADESGPVNILQSNTAKVIEGLRTRLAESSQIMLGIQSASHVITSSVRDVVTAFQSSDKAYQDFLSSNRQLDAASKISGVSLSTLKNTAKETEDNFKLNTIAANQFTTSVTKLTNKAGDISNTGNVIKALMDVGAGQGMNSAATLTAFQQAVLGIDEGTDKLFQKNPIVIYQEFAASIGTTAGKLTDQQKAQAMVNEVLKTGAKVQGSYNEFLESGAGKQQIMNNQYEQARIKMGQNLQPVMTKAISILSNILDIFNKLSPSTQTFVFILGVLVLALGKIAIALAPVIAQMGALNISMGGLPVLIGLAVTALTAFGIASATTSKSMEELTQETLKNREVSAEYKQILDELNLTAKNMAEAYDQIANSIMLMTNAQLDSAEKFIQAEKLKMQALISVNYAKYMAYGDVATMTAEKYANTDILGSGLNREIAKLDGLLEKLAERRKTIGKDDPPPKPPGDKGKKEKEEKDALEAKIELLKEEVELYQQTIGLKGKSHVVALQELETFVASNNQYAQSLKYLQFRKSLMSEHSAELKKQSDLQNQIKEDEKKRFDETKNRVLEDLSSQIKSAKDISKAKIELLDDEFKKKKELLKLEADTDINNLYGKGYSDDRIQEMKILRLQKLQKDLSDLETEQQQKKFDTILSLANQIGSVLGFSADSFGGKLLYYMNTAVGLANSILAILQAFGIVKSGLNIFGLLFPGSGGADQAFASGGFVPGTGNSDSVRAMLTPGEFVIRKSQVQALMSNFGSGFLPWLNGGGMFPSTAGRYFNGGYVMPSVSSSGTPQYDDWQEIAVKFRGDEVTKIYRRNLRKKSRSIQE